MGSKNGEDGTGRWWDVDQLFHFGHVKLRYLLDATVVVLKQMNDMLQKAMVDQSDSLFAVIAMRNWREEGSDR